MTYIILQDDEICSANRTTADEDAAVSVQKQTARVQLYCNMALYLAAIPTAILMGAYSDKAGKSRCSRIINNAMKNAMKNAMIYTLFI